MLFTQTEEKKKKRPTDLSQEFKVSPLFLLNWYSDTHNLQHSPLTKGFDSGFQL